MADDRAQARREAATLLGVDIDHLSAADGLRVDMVSALRLVIDSEQATILTGGSADLGKLNVAVQSLIALLPNRELPEPASSRADPRQIMWETYSGMRARAAAVFEGYDGKVKQVAALQGEVERLRARVAELEADASGGGNSPKSGENSPVGGNVVPMSRPSSGAAAPPKPVSPSPAAASAPVAGDLVMVVDPSSQEPWRDYVEPDGSIRSTPFSRGKYWGPV